MGFGQAEMDHGQAGSGGQVPRKSPSLRFVLLISAAALVAAVAVAVLIPVAVVGSLFWFGEDFETQDRAEYGIYEGHIETEDALFSQYSQLLIFPSELPANATVDEFFYACSSRGLDNSYQLLLDYRLPPDEFKAELERLEGLSVEHEGTTNRVIFDREHFSYPAYVTAFTANGDCEFALIDEEHDRVIAVLAMGGRGSLDRALFPQSVPDYDGGIDWLGFSLYHFEVEEGVAVMAPA